MPEPMPLPVIRFYAPLFELDAKKPFSVLTFGFHVQVIGYSNNQTNLTLLTFFYSEAIAGFRLGRHLRDEPKLRIMVDGKFKLLEFPNILLSLRLSKFNFSHDSTF